ncbi:MAG: ATP-dependent zinc protease [Alphaproteobacteria bacterium]|nr:ATP-dependent zinc protease [Alphaproteobacteria bacterium]
MRKSHNHAGPAAAPKRRRLRPRKRKPTIGWREWVGLPALGIERIKAKVDTGARTAALHAWSIEPFDRNGETWVRFDIHPVQRDNQIRVSCEARLRGRRAVRSSGGHSQMRLVIVTEVILGGQSWPIEVTLTNRDQMGFRMLLGRASVRGRFVVDPSTSYRGRKLNADGQVHVGTDRHVSTERKNGS